MDFRCPRCGTAKAATGLVDVATPLRAVPVDSAPLLAQTVPQYVPQPRILEPTVGPAEPDPLPASGLFVPDAGDAPTLVMHERFEPPAKVEAAPAGLGAQAARMEKTMPRQPGAATRFVMWLGIVAWRVDRTTYGRRLWLLALFGGGVLACWGFLPNVYPFAGAAYGFLLSLLLLARMWWTRDDDGSWSWSRFAERTFTATWDGVSWLFEVETFSLFGLLDRLRIATLAVGTALMVLAPPLATLTAYLIGDRGEALIERLGTPETLGLWFCAFGGAVWLLKYLQGRSPVVSSLRSNLVKVSLAPPGSVPAAIDVWESPAATVPAELREFVELLRRWRPRQKRTEAEYEAAPVRFLEKAGADVSSQRPLESADGEPIGRMTWCWKRGS
ncbi:MAG: hypothetical protein JXA57_11490 [Armatimonadetes bacterium]|nr:hypothetical protein [Armatimonadota bacterium]